ncbi:TonB-dependent receptor [Pontibacter chitinilyticus]|uniref:TonB-dependent receptor n=1 Tax=Pontibacter chitinilyticus TaxID=2674989 RepID=UPI003219D540
MHPRYILLLLLLLLVLESRAQERQQTYKLSGIVRNNWGVRLKDAFLVISPGAKGLSTDKDGYYTVQLPEGTYTIACQYIGMVPFKQTVRLDKDVVLDVQLVEKNFNLMQVEVTAKPSMSVNSTGMGSSYIDQKLLTRMPKLLGEADVLRSVSALPGVVNAGEGTSGFYVRGGSADQNLVLLDDAPVFNANHLFGFYSVYNPDILKSYVLYRSGTPARYGGRISSILDVSMEDGNTDKMRYQIGLSPITAKLSMDGPISPKVSMLVAARGAYPDYILKMFPSKNIKNSSGYFYDGNFKLKYRPGKNDNLSFSSYYSADGFKFPYDTTYHWTNKLGTLKWNHLFSDQFAGTATLVKSVYQNTVEGVGIGEEFKLNSGLDYSQAKLDFGYFGQENHQLDFGASAALYDIQPGDLVPHGTSSLNRRTLERDKGYEFAVYGNDEIKLSQKLSVSVGLRATHYRKVGPSAVYLYADGEPRSELTVYDTLQYGAGKTIQVYQGLEPRLSVKYSLSDQAALKVGLSRTRQYIQLISNTAAITPVDMWKLSNKYIKPQMADQLSMGYFFIHPENRYEFSWEVYYKKLYNQLDYKDGAVLLLNPTLEADLLTGSGYAYGSEWMLKKDKGRLTGWVSLSYARSFRKIKGDTPEETINGGKAYPSNYDKPINLNIFADYHLSPKWKASTTFTYTTGRPITASDSWYWYQDQIYANYAGRNQERMPDYHRLDVALTREIIKTKYAEYSGGISVYNLYGRKNAYSTLYQHYYGEPPSAYKLSIIGAPIPSVNFNVNF